MRLTSTSRLGHQSRRGSSGFTLIELLIVIAIIAVLISILVPALSSAREQGMSVKCLAHQRGLGSAGMMFADSHEGRFQLVSSEQGNDDADVNRIVYAYDGSGELLSWVVALARSAGTGIEHNSDWGARANSLSEALTRTSSMSSGFEIAVCPSDKVGIATPFYPNSTQLMSGDESGGLLWGYLSYGVNEDLTGAQDGYSQMPPVGRYDASGTGAWRIGQRSPFAGERLQGRIDKANDPSTLLLLADAGADGMDEALAAGANGNTDPGSVASLIISALATGPMLEHVQDKWPQRIPTQRHAKGAINVIFADFHGERATPRGWRRSSADQTVYTPKGYNTTVRVSPYAITGPVRSLD